MLGKLLTMLRQIFQYFSGAPLVKAIAALATAASAVKPPFFAAS